MTIKELKKVVCENYATLRKIRDARLAKSDFEVDLLLLRLDAACDAFSWFVGFFYDDSKDDFIYNLMYSYLLDEEEEQ